jgi:hypothetical protein
MDEVANYLTDIRFMWEYIHVLTAKLTRKYKLQGVYLHDNLSEGGPFRCYYDLYTNEQRPTTQEFQAFAESLRSFPFPITCCVRERYRYQWEGGRRQQFCALEMTIDYGFLGLN